MEKLATSLQPSLYSIAGRSLKSTPHLPSRFRFVRVCSSFKADHPTKSRRLRVSGHPGAVKSPPDSLETIQYDSDLEDAVASLEEAFNQVSRSENINFVTDDGESLARTIKSSRKKRRLDLGSRINLKKIALEEREQASTLDDDVWSSEADELLRSSFRIEVVDWRKVRHSFLTPEEEQKLVGLIEPAKNLEQLRDELQRALGRKPSDDEWASAANINYKTLRRKLQLGQAARNKLIQHNCRLVLFVARKYKRDAGSFTLEDLCQEGLKGLVTATQQFNPNRGSRFSTYAVFWIRAMVLRAIAKSGQIIRFPLRFAAKRLELRKARRQLTSELGRIPAHEEVMERVGMDAKQYWAIYNSKLRVRSLNDEVGRTGEELQDYLPETGEIAANTSELRAEVEKLLEDLKPKARMVLRHRYGLEDGAPEIKSLREVGRRLNMSQEMVRKYEARALQQLKQKPEALSYIRQCLPSTSSVQNI